MEAERARVRERAVSEVGGRLVTWLLASCRFELIAGSACEEAIVKPRLPAVYVLWHGRLLPCAYHYRDLRLGTLISRNRDGDYISGMIRKWGFTIVRGSSSRGGATGLRELVRMLRAGVPVAITPDGPRGPRQKMKLGALRAAQQAGVPLVPVSAGARRGWYFGKWDRFLVPRPFTRIAVALGEPCHLGAGLGEDELKVEALRIEESLDRLTRLVDGAAQGRES